MQGELIINAVHLIWSTRPCCSACYLGPCEHRRQLPFIIRAAVHSKNQENDIQTEVIHGLWSHNLK